MYPLKKGKFASQAHVGLPQGTYEEEHGRKGFYGKSAHLYHTHPPTGWIRFEGNLRPHCFDLNALEAGRPARSRGPARRIPGQPGRYAVRVAPLRSRCRSTTATRMATNWSSSTAAHGTLETDFGPLPFEPGDYLVIPRAVTYRFVPQTPDNFFLIMQSRTEFDPPDSGLVGQHALYDPATVITPEPDPHLDDDREWEVHIKVEDRHLEGGVPVQSAGRGGVEGRPHRVEDQHARYPPHHEPARAPAAQRPHHLRHRRRGGVQFPAAPARRGPRRPQGAVLPSQHRLRRVHLLSRRRFLQQGQHPPRLGHAASARHPPRAASQSAAQPGQEDPHRRVRRDAGRLEPHPRPARRGSAWSGKSTGRAGWRK